MPNFTLSLKSGLTLIEQPGNGLVLQSAARRVTLKNVSPGLRAALTSLSTTGATAAELEQQARNLEGEPALPRFYKSLQQLADRGLICRSVRLGSEVLALAEPLTTTNCFTAGEIVPDQAYALSRFAYSHVRNKQMVLESPLAQAQVILPHWAAAAMVTLLAQPRHCADIAGSVPGLPVESVQEFLNLLLSANMLTGGAANETENLALRQWEFHDLLFHTRSRRGRHANPSGNTMRFKDQIEPLPVLKPDMSAQVISLYRPDLDAVAAAAPFTQVLEQRRSIRTFGDPPITIGQLGEFLYRSARVRSIVQTELGALSSRPYPSGGAMYELELYLAVDKCTGLDRGLYHYQPQTHQLHKLATKESEIEALLQDAARSMSQPARPHVLIIMAARFQRVAWKYQTLAYAMILKNVGVLQQTMNLVATAMGLAACALGNGDSDLFARAAGTDYYAETSVGELALGSMPDSVPAWDTVDVDTAKS